MVSIHRPWHDPLRFGRRRDGDSPLNYAVGRLEANFEAGHGNKPVFIRLFPGLAEPGTRERWLASLTIRFYADSEVALAAAAGGPTAPADDETTLFPIMIASPWPLENLFLPAGSHGSAGEW